jgi:hypothetical protein
MSRRTDEIKRQKPKKSQKHFWSNKEIQQIKKQKNDEIKAIRQNTEQTDKTKQSRASWTTKETNTLIEYCNKKQTLSYGELAENLISKNLLPNKTKKQIISKINNLIQDGKLEGISNKKNIRQINKENNDRIQEKNKQAYHLCLNDKVPKKIERSHLCIAKLI